MTKRKEKLINNKVLSKNKWLRRTAIAGLVGAIGLGVSTYLYNHDNSQDNPRQRTAISSFEGLEKYIDTVVEFGDDTTKPTLYMLFQEHGVGFFNVESVRTKINEGVVGTQLSIYRILEYLHRNEGLQLICNEGFLAHEKYDEDKPFILREQYPDGYDNLSDTELKAYLRTSSDGAFLAGLNYPKMHLTGFERPGVNIHTRSFFENMEKAATIINKYEERGKLELKEIEELEKLNKEIDELSLIVKGLERKKRSYDAIYFAKFHANRLYDRRLIQNRDVAIVIGLDHEEDFSEVAALAESGKFDYRLVFISPKK